MITVESEGDSLRFSWRQETGDLVLAWFGLVLCAAAILGGLALIFSAVGHMIKVATADPASYMTGDPWWVDALGILVILFFMSPFALGAHCMVLGIRAKLMITELRGNGIVHSFLDADGQVLRRREYPRAGLKGPKIRALKTGDYMVSLCRRGLSSDLSIGSVGSAREAREIAGHLEAALQTAA